jgi:hypothetical protein
VGSCLLSVLLLLLLLLPPLLMRAEAAANAPAVRWQPLVYLWGVSWLEKLP